MSNCVTTQCKRLSRNDIKNEYNSIYTHASLVVDAINNNKDYKDKRMYKDLISIYSELAYYDKILMLRNENVKRVLEQEFKEIIIDEDELKETYKYLFAINDLLSCMNNERNYEECEKREKKYNKMMLSIYDNACENHKEYLRESCSNIEYSINTRIAQNIKAMEESEKNKCIYYAKYGDIESIILLDFEKTQYKLGIETRMGHGIMYTKFNIENDNYNKISTQWNEHIINGIISIHFRFFTKDKHNNNNVDYSRINYNDYDLPHKNYTAEDYTKLINDIKTTNRENNERNKLKNEYKKNSLENKVNYGNPLFSPTMYRRLPKCLTYTL